MEVKCVSLKEGWMNWSSETSSTIIMIQLKLARLVMMCIDQRIVSCLMVANIIIHSVDKSLRDCKQAID